MIKYSCGFLFTEDKENVLLILKNSPDWMKGYLTGIGGHQEPNETPALTMVREFEVKPLIKIGYLLMRFMALIILVIFIKLLILSFIIKQPLLLKS